MLITGVALMAGLMLGIITAFARRSLNRSVEDPNIIEKSLDTPVYAAIQYSKYQKLIEKKLKGKSAPGDHHPVLWLWKTRKISP